MLVLHVGLHKTGTSYLQHRLLANRDTLAAAGVALAPRLHPVQGNHHPLVAALGAAGYSREAFDALLDEIAAAPGDRLLVTAEEISHLILTHPDRAAALRDAVVRHFTPRIVIGLRRQDFLKESLFAQAARTWYTGDIRDDQHYDLDHDGRLAALEALFGRENIRVLLKRDGGRSDLFAEMLAAMDVGMPSEAFRDVAPRNVSTHRRLALFMASLPKSARARTRREAMHFPTQVSRLLRRSDAIADDGIRFLLSPAERHALVAAHLEGNRAVVARYGIPDPGPFLALPDPDEPWTPPAPITAAERAAAFRVVLRGIWQRPHPLRALGATGRLGLAFARMARAT